jgi:Uri superfamily endonuclease
VKGSYILLIWVENTGHIRFGRRRSSIFREGLYAYVGSGLNNLTKRVHRHFTHRKRLWWHIDYLTRRSTVIGAFTLEYPHPLEERIAAKLSSYYQFIDGFGSSDRRSRSHLFYLNSDITGLIRCLNELMNEIKDIKLAWISNQNIV